MMLGRFTLGALACVFLTGVALALATYILIGVPVITAVASTPAPTTQSVAVELPTGVTVETAEYVVIPPPTQAVGPTDRPFLTTEIPSPEQITCQEDEPCWDCATMGNLVCGPNADGLWSVPGADMDPCIRYWVYLDENGTPLNVEPDRRC